MFTAHEYVAALQRVKNELLEQFPGVVRRMITGALVFRTDALTVENFTALREYLRSRTDPQSDVAAVTADQAAWGKYYEVLTDQLRSIAPGVLREIEQIEYREALTPVLAEVCSKLAANPAMTIPEFQQLREYAESRAGLLQLAAPSVEQASWQSMYEMLTGMMRKSYPELMAKLEPAEKQIRNATIVKAELEKFANSRRREKGFKVPIGFLVAGFVVGLFPSQIGRAHV